MSVAVVPLLLLLVLGLLLGLAALRRPEVLPLAAGGLERFEPQSSWVSVGTMGLGQASATWSSAAVPKIIHQEAPADRGRWPATWEGCHATWMAVYPEREGFRHMMWTDESMEAFCAERYPAFHAKMFSRYKKIIKKVDVFRYLILFHFGGLYADMDYECVADFWDQLPPGRASVAASAHAGEGLQNALMASPPGHPFWQYVLYEAYPAIDEPNVLVSTGPALVVRAARFAPPDMLNVLPAERFSVYSSGRGDDNVVVHLRSDKGFEPTELPGVYAAHHGTANWE